MELSEYQEKLKVLESNFEIQKKNLAIEYAMANNPHKKGDLICDSSGCILIDTIVTYLNYDKPSCVYRGIVMNKNLSPNKSGKRGSIFQTSIKTPLINTGLISHSINTEY